MTSPEQSVTYKGVCHCHSVRFTVDLAPLESLTIYDCNCTNCRIHGFNSTRTYRKNLNITKGEEYISKPYSYISKDIGLKFCTKCGTSLFFDTLHPENGENGIGVNTRVLEGVDVDTHKLTFVDIRSMFNDKVPKRD